MTTPSPNCQRNWPPATGAIPPAPRRRLSAWVRCTGRAIHLKKAIPNFCRAVVQNNPIVIRGTGQDARQPIHIQDILSGILAWVRKEDSPAFGQYLLVGNERVTIRSVAEMIAGLDKQYTAGIRFENAVKPETQQQFDNTHTCQALNWQPQISLREGLTDTLKGMKHG